jgi:hypothetical protein
MNKKRFILISILVMLSLALSACRLTDVVGRYAVSSFEQLMEQNTDKVYYENGNQLWHFTSPGGERFGWTQNPKDTNPDIIMEFDARPFIDAGLRIGDLPEGYVYDRASGKLTIVVDLGNNKFEYKDEPTPSSSFAKIVQSHRKLIEYHSPMDHYGILIGHGNKFEWAKDTSTNEKDIVFILDPQPLIDAGVDPEQVEGWNYAEVEIKMGKMAHKFLKPYNLR